MTFSSKSLGHEGPDAVTLRSSIIPADVQSRRFSTPSPIFTLKLSSLSECKAACTSNAHRAARRAIN